MKQIIITLLFLIPITAFCQNREVHVKTHPNGDTTLWFTWRVELCDQIKLEQVHHTKHPWYFRLSTDRQSISLWKDGNDKTSGKITNWVKEEVPFEEEPTNRIHYNSFQLDSAIVLNLMDWIVTSLINEIPDEDSITGWEQGNDGIEYIIESADRDDYYFKTYWTPIAQDSLPEAIVVQRFVNNALELSNANDIWDDFSSTIPYECYLEGGMIVVCNILTKREQRKYRKERRIYRQQNQQ